MRGRALRKVREGDPIIAVLEAKEREATAAVEADPDDEELAVLRDWLSAFLVFVRLFDQAVGLVSQLDPRELERSLSLLGRIPDSTILRLFDLLGPLASVADGRLAEDHDTSWHLSALLWEHAERSTSDD